MTGVALFADNGGCTGGGGSAVVANNVFYSLGGGIYVNATTGAQLRHVHGGRGAGGQLDDGVLPSVGDLERQGIERLFDPVDFQRRRRFGHLPHHCGPGGHHRVFERTDLCARCGHRNAALDGECGWHHLFRNSGNVIPGLAAGDGLLVVPAGNTLSAFTLSTNP